MEKTAPNQVNQTFVEKLYQNGLISQLAKEQVLDMLYPRRWAYWIAQLIKIVGVWLIFLGTLITIVERWLI